MAQAIIRTIDTLLGSSHPLTPEIQSALEALRGSVNRAASVLPPSVAEAPHAPAERLLQTVAHGLRSLQRRLAAQQLEQAACVCTKLQTLTTQVDAAAAATGGEGKVEFSVLPLLAHASARVFWEEEFDEQVAEVRYEAFLEAWKHNYGDYMADDWPLLQLRLMPPGESTVTVIELALFSDRDGILGAFQTLRPPVFDVTAPSSRAAPMSATTADEPESSYVRDAPAPASPAPPAADDAGVTPTEAAAAEPTTSGPAESITSWLAGLGLEKYAEQFAKNEVDMSVLTDLTDDDVSALVSGAIGPRRKIMNAIREMRRY